MKITVFTPTFNRAYIIENLYNSLKRQTFVDFEWLVIDDGSTDDTEILFKKLVEEKNAFQIRYYKQSNGGKCRAINRALDLAAGELFFTVDSDDYLTDDALEKIALWEKQLPQNEKYCGIAGNLGISRDSTPNTLFKTEYYEGNLLDRYSTVDGERAIAFYTEIHRKYKYPEFENERFITEAVAWNRMAHDGYKMRFYDDIIWIYEYRDDGLTKSGNKLFIDNPRGYGIWLKEKIRFTNNTVIARFKLFYTFSCELYPYYSEKKIAECIQTSRLIIWLCIKLHQILKMIKG